MAKNIHIHLHKTKDVDRPITESQLAEIKQYYDMYKRKSSSELVDIYRKVQRVSSSFTAAEVGGKQALIDMLLRDRYGQWRLDIFYSRKLHRSN